MGVDIEKYIKTCIRSQMLKHLTQSKIEKLRPLSISKQKNYCISMAFMTGILKVAGMDVIMVIVCRLRNWSAFVPCLKQVTVFFAIISICRYMYSRIINTWA